MYRYMNRFMYHESILFTQAIMKIAKMNRFTVLESQNRLSTNPEATQLDGKVYADLKDLREKMGLRLYDLAHTSSTRDRAK